MIVASSPHARRRLHWGAPVLVALAVAFLPWAAQASSDPLFAEQWALQRIGAPEAWARSTGAGVRIGVVDTGVDLAHEDLAGKVVAHTSCVGSGGDPARCSGSGQDDHGHGTHVAGIAAASKDNGKGIAGVAPDAQLVVAKALDAQGSGTTEDINAGIRWVVDHGAQVVNLSLGGNFLVTSLLGSSLREGVLYAWERGAVPVLAAGNTNLLGLGLGSAQYGSLPALVVGATGPDDSVAAYSSPTGNAQWALLAPGGTGTGTRAEDIVSTYWSTEGPHQYETLSGTSMATSHVAGAVALLLAQGHSATIAVTQVLATVDAGVVCGAGNPGCRGRLDTAAATGASPVVATPGAGATGGLLGLPLELPLDLGL